jgi:hypothetical protein
MTVSHKRRLNTRTESHELETFKDIEAKLQAAFLALPIARPKPEDRRIPVDRTIPELVRELATLRRVKREAPSWKAITTATKRLIAMQKNANTLLKYPLVMMGWPMQLRILVASVAHAKIPTRPARGTGAPPKDLARKAARITAERFFQLTGKKPTRTTPVMGGKSDSPFVSLLKESLRNFVH